LTDAGYGSDLIEFIIGHLKETAETAITNFTTSMTELSDRSPVQLSDGTAISSLITEFTEKFGSEYLDSIYNNYAEIADSTVLSNS
jgi:hypothetical protein